METLSVWRNLKTKKKISNFVAYFKCLILLTHKGKAYGCWYNFKLHITRKLKGGY
jgi:hypothetical protein